jgi:diguanylate cyclase (GGDEF)-like protein
MSSLSELSHVMLASRSLGEVFGIVPRFMQQLFPGTSGRLYTMNASSSFIESRCAWGSPRLAEDVIGPEDCWGLRRGTLHSVAGPGTDMHCAHQKALDPCPASLCAPLTAQNEGLGLLYIEPDAPALARGEALRLLAASAAEQLALGIANMRMREQLRSQSIRDVLTGLYNRRFLEESAERELHLARRRKVPLAVIMLDVDHFKRFNDAHGHESGDEVLRAVGALIRRTVRASDICCRYGGEEFTVLMPEADAAIAMARAERLRNAARELRLGALPAVTLSLGVAIFPRNGETWEELLRAADGALYEAKRGGRDRSVLCGADAEADTLAT